MSTYKLSFHCYEPLVWCGHKHTVNAFLVQKHFCLAHKNRVFCNNTLMSAIIQETGGPLRKERAVDGKLKSRLKWPYSEGNPPIIIDSLESHARSLATFDHN